MHINTTVRIAGLEWDVLYVGFLCLDTNGWSYSIWYVTYVEEAPKQYFDPTLYLHIKIPIYMLSVIHFVIFVVDIFQAFADLHESTKVRLLCQAWSDLFVLGLAQTKKVRTDRAGAWCRRDGTWRRCSGTQSRRASTWGGPMGVLHLKGTVPWDFLPLVFFIKLFLLGPVDMPRNDFNFFWLFAEIFDYFGASPASMTPAKHALPVSFTPVSNFSPVSTTPLSDTFTVLESFTGVNDTGKKFLTGVIDTGKASIRRCQWHRWNMYSPESMTPAKHVTGDNDTGDVMHHQCHWYRAVKIANFAGVNDTGEAFLCRCQ